MSFYFVSNTWIIHCGFIVHKHCSVWQYLLQIEYWRWIFRQADGAQSVFEMRKQIRNWLFVDKFNKNNLFSESIIEAVHVDEVYGWSIVVINFGYFACSLSEYSFFIVNKPVHRNVFDF
jgi:hypothetical protein